MANSTIKNINYPLETGASVITINSNTSYVGASSYDVRKWGRVVQFRINMLTKQQLSVGTAYNFGTMTGKVPLILTYIPTFRRDGGLGHGQLQLPTTSGGQMTFYPLNNVPSGVEIIVTGTYITNF